VDGDTVRLELDLGWHTYRVENCRIADINSPELSTDEGKAAKAYAQRLLPVDAEVTFVSKRLDNYGRPLGHILGRAGADFGQAMVAAGHAVPFMVGG
jgi:endonuclease YncB( thermonuclease family)